MAGRVSKKSIDRAGACLRDWWAGDDTEIDAHLIECFDRVADYRSTFSYPLSKVTMGLRSFVRTEASSEEGEVAQRLKRIPTILDKLNRLPNMKLTRMQDIGGCRAITRGGRDELYRVLARIEKRWDVKGVDDFITAPRKTGYRAVHVIVVRDERMIEIQLRTPSQHDWATTVDRASGRLRRQHGYNLKDGEGPDELLRFFALAAQGMELQEIGEPTDEAFVAEFEQTRARVAPYFA